MPTALGRLAVEAGRPGRPAARTGGTPRPRGESGSSSTGLLAATAGRRSN